MIALPLNLMINLICLRTLREQMLHSCERMAEATIGCFAKWKYCHYFEFMTHSDKNITLKCTLYPGGKNISTSLSSSSNLLKHLSWQHCSVKLEAISLTTKNDLKELISMAI